MASAPADMGPNGSPGIIYYQGGGHDGFWVCKQQVFVGTLVEVHCERVLERCLKRWPE
jgi:hypothetical protein